MIPGLLLLLGAIGAWFLCTSASPAAGPRQPSCRSYAASRAGPDAEAPYYGASQHYGAPQQTTGPVKAAAQPVAFPPAVERPQIAHNFMLEGAFTPSEEMQAYDATFAPTTLQQSMPASWRTDGTEDTGASSEEFAEFSRYAISPNQMQKSENMRSMLRLGELSRDGLARTLGQKSLLRDYVTPVGPLPMGNGAMLWNDSSVRQNFIASATGRFPELAESC